MLQSLLDGVDSSESESSEFETVTRAGGESGGVDEFDGSCSGDEGRDKDVRMGEPLSEAMGLSGDCGREARQVVSSGCMLVLDVTVRSLVMRCVFRSTDRVPRDCWSRQVASLRAGGSGRQVGGTVLYGGWVLVGTGVGAIGLNQCFKKSGRMP
jgi:hypothetical protein